MTPERINKLRGIGTLTYLESRECLDAVESLQSERDFAVAHVEALQRDCARLQDEKQALSDRMDAEIKRSNALARCVSHREGCATYNGFDCTCGMKDLLAGGAS